MKIFYQVEGTELGTPIGMAEAIINEAIERASTCKTSEAIENAHDDLAQIAEHIMVYLKYNRYKE